MTEEMKEEKEEKYAQVKLPKTLVVEVDKLIGTFGFTSRAEIVKSALRSLLLDYHKFIGKYPEETADPNE